MKMNYSKCRHGNVFDENNIKNICEKNLFQIFIWRNIKFRLKKLIHLFDFECQRFIASVECTITTHFVFSNNAKLMNRGGGAIGH